MQASAAKTDAETSKRVARFDHLESERRHPTQIQHRGGDSTASDRRHSNLCIKCIRDQTKQADLDLQL